MSCWQNKNVIKSYSALLPAEYIEGWKLERIILTTFSLHMNQLNALLYDLNAFPLVAKNKVHVFYDAVDRSGKDTKTPIISEKYIHGLRIVDNKNLYAFHPKILLLRYEKDEKFRYVLIVTSKNISEATRLDVYGVSYGEVAEGEEQDNNGKNLSDFLKSISQASNPQCESELKDIVEEVKRVSFRMNFDEGDVRFYTANEVWTEVQDKSDLIIVSPFLSDALVNALNKKVRMIISTEQGFVSLEEKTIEGLINQKKCVYWSANEQNLHAKIYCWKEENKTHYIIGSSNATNNGCNTAGRIPSNMEFNIGFVRGPEEYNAFLEDICSFCEDFEFFNYEIWKDKNKNDFDPRSEFDRFCRTIQITCEVVDGTYNVKVIKENTDSIADVRFEVKVPTEEEFKALDMNQRGVLAEWSLKAPVAMLMVKVINTQAFVDDERVPGVSVFCYSLYNQWEQKEKEILDRNAQGAYIKLQEQYQKQLLRGGAKPSVFLADSVIRKESNGQRKRTQDKTYAYEEILSLAQKYEGEAFVQKILELEQFADNILLIRKDDDKQNKLKELIIKIRDGIKDE